MKTPPHHHGLALFRRSPYVSLLLGAVMVLLHTYIPPENLSLNIEHRSIVTLFSSHWAHWSNEHMLWSGGAFIVLGMVCERISRLKFIAVVLFSSLVVSLSVLGVPLGIDSYAGLSGIDSALFGFILATRIHGTKNTHSRLTRLWVYTIGFGFVAKISYELISESAFFVSASTDMLVVPVAHIAGFISGCMVAWFAPFILHRPTPTIDRPLALQAEKEQYR